MRMIAAVFALALAAFACGCHPALGDRYTVEIDPTFTAAQQEAVLAALEDWSANVPVKFSPVVTACSHGRDGSLCIHNSTHADIVANHGAGPTTWGVTFGSSSGEDVDGAETWIATDVIPAADFQGVLAHEIGHGMGLEHETGATSELMAPGLSGWSRTVTANDAAQWYRVRGQVVR